MNDIKSVKVLTLNLNGIRSAAKKDFFQWLRLQDIDVICFQEVRANIDQIPNECHELGYHAFWSLAQKPGYSGVGILSKSKPKNIVYKTGHNIMDSEGRYVGIEFEDIKISSLYLPSGTSGEERQKIKYECLDFMSEYLSETKKSHVICGDFNIAHQKIDLKNWQGNQKNSGFLPEERAWLDQFTTKLGFVDSFRTLFPDKAAYTWWSSRGRARENNVGWRIDYHFVSPDLASKMQDCWIHYDHKFSDHAPQVLELKK